MENNIFITIVGTNYYYGMKPFEIGRFVKIVKEPTNEHDCEAIRAELPFIDKIGYVANSAHTIAKGTYSAGRLYDYFDDYAYARVLFVTSSKVICHVYDKEEIEGEAQEEKAVETTSVIPDVNAKPFEKKQPIGFIR